MSPGALPAATGLQARICGGEIGAGSVLKAPPPAGAELLEIGGPDIAIADGEFVRIDLPTRDALVWTDAADRLPPWQRMADGTARASGLALEAGTTGGIVPRTSTAAAPSPAMGHVSRAAPPVQAV